MATLSALVSSLDAELRRLGYKDSTLVWYRGAAGVAWRGSSLPVASRGAGPDRCVMRSARSPAPPSPGPTGQRCA